MAVNEVFVEVTRKGCVMIPKEFREKHPIEGKALLVDTKEGVLIKSVLDPLAEKGSLKKLFAGRTTKQLLREARFEEEKAYRTTFK
jgi:bifunctional DNA-binding transcriptional regulator/antitoxin component of YhaV-PrlF toxin-antitoxin module